MTGRTMTLTIGAVVVAAMIFSNAGTSRADTRAGLSFGGRNLLAGRPLARHADSHYRDGDRGRDRYREGDHDRGRWSRREHRPLRTSVIPRGAGRLAELSRHGYRPPIVVAPRPVVVVPRRQVYRPRCDRQSTIQITIGW